MKMLTHIYIKFPFLYRIKVKVAAVNKLPFELCSANDSSWQLNECRWFAWLRQSVVAVSSGTEEYLRWSWQLRNIWNNYSIKEAGAQNIIFTATKN